MSTDEPAGWRQLQAMALRETDPKRLVEIIDEMNRLVDEHEGKTKQRDSTKKSSCTFLESFGP
jgi:hypothetical protein